MKTKSLLTYFLFSIYTFINGQSIQLISQKSQKPLTKVSFLTKNGELIGYTDIDGKIDKNLIQQEDENFTLIYNNTELAILTYQQLQREIIPLEEKITDIETVVINPKNASKYVIVKGNFNTYVTVNNTINCYADGVITYIFDNKTQKFKSSNIQDYRIYRLEKPNIEKKQTSTWDYNNFLDLPSIKKLGNAEDYYTNKNGFKVRELNTDSKTELEITGESLQKKEFSILGYRIFDLKTILNISFESQAKKIIKNFKEYNEVNFIKLKHKSEEKYNQVINYNNFYPTEITFADDYNIEQKKFNTNYSNYSTEYWKDPNFPNMQNVFNNFFKEQLKEKENKK